MPDSSDADTATSTRDSRLVIGIDDEQLELVGIQASEGLSQSFLFTVDVLSTLGEFDVLPHLGKPAMVETLRDGEKMRFFHGVITDAYMIGEAATGTNSWQGTAFQYRLTLQPKAFFHSQGSDFRIFQDKTVLDIVQDVLGRCGITYDTKMQSDSASSRMLKYCVQFGESDFGFVSRLLEEHGLYYFYRHEEDDHVLVLCDSPNSHEESAMSPLHFNVFGASMGNAGSELRGGEIEYVTQWQQHLSTGAESVATMRDHDFQTPTQAHQVRYTENAAHAADGVEIYTWPGRYYVDEDGTKLSTYQLEARRAQRTRYDATSGCAGIQVLSLIHI